MATGAHILVVIVERQAFIRAGEYLETDLGLGIELLSNRRPG